MPLRGGPRPPGRLVAWAATPALAMSVWLLHVGEAPPAAQVLQVVVGAAALVTCLALARVRAGTSLADSPWLPAGLAMTLFLPLCTGDEAGPARWLELGIVRVYIAPLVLPLTLFLLGAPSRSPALQAACVAAVAAALALQPDASQLTAFAVATLVTLAGTPPSGRLTLGLVSTLAGGAIVAWRAPDPLLPVPYVEGVFSLAAETAPWLLPAAIAAAALPVAALARTAQVTRSAGALAVAAYYASILALAPLQLTPVPLLGFGAGPILGYFLVAGMIAPAEVR